MANCVELYHAQIDNDKPAHQWVSDIQREGLLPKSELEDGPHYYREKFVFFYDPDHPLSPSARFYDKPNIVFEVPIDQLQVASFSDQHHLKTKIEYDGHWRKKWRESLEPYSDWNETEFNTVEFVSRESMPPEQIVDIYPDGLPPDERVETSEDIHGSNDDWVDLTGNASNCMKALGYAD